jgi:hypothetical protein
MLKSNPRKFWNMLKQRTDDNLGIPARQFTDFNKAQFYDDTIV